MQLVSLLDAKLIHYEERHESLEMVYYDLVERICQHHKLPVCGKKLLEIVLNREEEASMVYPSGVAIPHVRMDDFDDTIIAICFLRQPILVRDIKLKWVVMIITDKSSSKLYLNVVAALLRLSKDEVMMSVLEVNNNGHDAYNTFKDFKIAVKEDLTLRDIMISDPVTVKPQTNLREISKLMNEYGYSFFPVVDDMHKYLGEIQILNYLKVGVPDYLLMMDNIQFLRSFEPLEKIFENEEKVIVGDIMEKGNMILSPDDSIIEAVFEMIQHKKPHCSIVEHGVLVGVVTAMDIYRKVIRA
ncbi:MAG: CBS domain-containing protein [Candidatus Cloacimonetes bacterium]|nr:CBS domain-containing protein [Candidatus Cloacimonadota bacterium]